MSRKYPTLPIVGVGVVIFNSDNKVLLIRRNNPPRQNELSLPGGVQKLGETIYGTAIREVSEETSLNIEVHGIVDVVDSIHKDNDGLIRYHYTLIDVFASTEVNGRPTANSDARHPIWVSESDLRSLDIWSETKRIIKLALEMKAIID